MTKLYLIESNDLISKEENLNIAKYLQKMDINLDSIFYNDGKNNQETATTLSTILCKNDSLSLIGENKLNTLAKPTPGLNEDILIVAEIPFLKKIIYLLLENETINIKRNSIICIEHSEDKNWELEYIINYDRLKFIQNEDEKVLNLNKTIINKYKDMELNFNSILDKSADYFYVKDTDYKFCTVNENFAKLTGHQHWPEIVGKTDFEIFPKSIAQFYHNDDKNVIELGQPVLSRLERYPMLDGKEGWVKTSKLPIFDENGNVIRMFGFSTDVTSLISAELRLKKLNETLEDKVKFATIDLERAQKLSKIGSWRFDIKENIFKCTHQVYTILGIDENQNKISSLNDLFHILHVDISNNEPYKEIYKETHKINNNAGIKHIEERYITTFDDYGNALILNGTIQDITEEVQKNQLLSQNFRMAQMGEMISMIAHQWRQPLAAIAATSVDLQMKLELESFDLKQEDGEKECKAYFNAKLENIDSFVQNLTTTMDDFRTFYKPNKQKSYVDFSVPVKKALSVIKDSLLSDGINIVQTYDKGDKKIRMHTNELMQVVLIILKNSQDTFKKQETKNPEIKITSKYSSDDRVVLEICDNGGGIPEDILPNIFDPYFSTKNEKNGTGLGLYLSIMIVEEHHNGKLLVNNNDNGVCFTIEFQDENAEI